MSDASIYYLTAALEHGDLDRAWDRAQKMPRGRIGLDHALGLVALLALLGAPDRAELAADRWIQRARSERPDLPIDHLTRLLDWLPDLAAVTELQTLCEQQAWPVALATLDHLLPGGSQPHQT